MAHIQGHILVVDDDTTNRLILSIDLKQQGHTVVLAENGRQALEMLRMQPFDLVLLDIVMPEMNGLEVLAHMKNDTELREIPVIVISAIELMESVIKCIEMGAEDHLPKPFDAVLLQARINASLQKKRFRDREVEYLRQVARITDAAVAIENQSFEPDSLVDITTRSDALGTLARVFQRMAREVYAREQQLAQDNRMKAAFIDVISHELRSPFAAAAMSVELLGRYAERQMFDELQEQVRQLDKELTQGRQLIDTIISFAEQVRREAKLVVEKTDFAALIREASAALEVLAQNRQLHLTYHLAPNIPPIFVDRERMKETIYHLVHNAIKFTQAGGTVEVHCRAEETRIIFQVKDTGVGVPPQKLNTIWEPFSQNSDRVRRGMEGLGLGLALVRATIQAHWGDVAAISVPGQGSTFGFYIPIMEH